VPCFKARYYILSLPRLPSRYLLFLFFSRTRWLRAITSTCHSSLAWRCARAQAPAYLGGQWRYRRSTYARHCHGKAWWAWTCVACGAAFPRLPSPAAAGDGGARTRGTSGASPRSLQPGVENSPRLPFSCLCLRLRAARQLTGLAGGTASISDAFSPAVGLGGHRAGGGGAAL